MVLECRYKDQGRGKGRRDGKDWKRKRQQGNRVENTETKGLPASTWYEVWTSITLIPLWSRRACWTKVCARWGESLPPLSVTHQGQQRASQRAGLTRWEGWCCTCLGPLSWIEKTERREERFQEREVHKWEGWALCEWASWGCQGPGRQI